MKQQPHTCDCYQSVDTAIIEIRLKCKQRNCVHLHGVLLAFQFTSDELQCASGNVVPQVAALFDAAASRFGECVALV